MTSKRYQHLRRNPSGTVPASGSLLILIFTAEDAEGFAKDAEEDKTFACLCEDLCVPLRLRNRLVILRLEVRTTFASSGKSNSDYERGCRKVIVAEALAVREIDRDQLKIRTCDSTMPNQLGSNQTGQRLL